MARLSLAHGPRHEQMLRLVVLLTVWLSSCTSTPTAIKPPPFAWGQARAYGLEEATTVDALIRELEPRVRDLLDSDRGPAEVWMVERSDLDGNVAVTLDDKILISTSASSFLPRVIGHELGHWHSFVVDLPYLIEEGVAVYVEDQLDLSRPEVRSIGPETDWRRFVTMDRRQWHRLDEEEEIEETYVAAFWLVNRIGLATLRRMEQEGRTSPDDVLRAAGLLSQGHQ